MAVLLLVVLVLGLFALARIGSDDVQVWKGI